MPRPEFQVHLLNDQGKRKAADLAQDFSSFLDTIERICGADGREMAVVRTKMEEASFFAKKAMAKRPENRQ